MSLQPTTSTESQRMLADVARGPAGDAPLVATSRPRMPLACGALGSYDRDRVLRAATLFSTDMRVVHETRDAILLLDREPRRWGDAAAGAAGIAWPSRLAPDTEPSGWQQVAREWNSVGIETGPAEPRLHTSVSGLSPLYLQREPQASYFATAIDPLARSTPAKLTVDWQAWSSIFALGCPIDGRTPFEEIEHIGAWRTISHPAGGEARIESPTWPWRAIEPTLTAAEGAEAIAAALNEVFARLAGQDLIVPMSAGRDSRLLSWLAKQSGAGDVETFTVYEDTGTRVAIDIATEAAKTLGFAHTQIEPAAEDFWEDSRCYQLSTDYQFPNAPWLGTPLRRAIGGMDGTVIDGIAGNALFEPTAREVVPEVITEPGPQWRALLWQKMRTRALRAAFRQEEAAAIGRLARDQFLAHCDPYTEHPARAALAFYEARTVRAIALRPSATLGQTAEVVSPLADTAVAEALLSVRADEKFDRALYTEVFRALDSPLADLSFSSEGAGVALNDAPRRRSSVPVMEGYREVVAAGPLVPNLAGKVRGWLTRPEPFPDGGRKTLNGMERPVTFHLWFERYAELLRPFDLADALGTPDRGA